MKFQSEIEIENTQISPIKIILEPWGEEIEISPKEKVVIKAFATLNGKFEVEERNTDIIVYLWSGATAKTYCKDVEIGGNRPIVPDVPKAFTTSKFLNFMFGVRKD